ncbi:hypothetical protein [Botrimarina mediterranea]|uniref:Uncharacterized protein n=1 Tax=Botrimarina mediterranea TaxID=2528022 RepID=A0A518K3T2_9BACT|nr:hypothetical protein [Botrimarina mediterranea]QDV72462.1 hypothetical protein Spa11_06390 [Botrimarina mediterranea]QDV77033.1 hypothetical protein K2D_06190 [Planctomycetes bacterium K2D]
MYANDLDPSDEPLDVVRQRTPIRKANGPGRDRKQKARRTSQRKQGGATVGGIHRRGSKRRSN